MIEDCPRLFGHADCAGMAENRQHVAMLNKCIALFPWNAVADEIRFLDIDSVDLDKMICARAEIRCNLNEFYARIVNGSINCFAGPDPGITASRRALSSQFIVWRALTYGTQSARRPALVARSVRSATKKSAVM